MRTICGLLAVGGLAGCESDVTLIERQVTDRWTQATGTGVDLLWVIDNSDSMLRQRERLAEGLASMVDALDAASADLRMAVSTMRVTPNEPTRLLGDPPILSLADAGALDTLERRTTTGVAEAPRSDVEQGLEAAARIQEGVADAAGVPLVDFPREEATFSVVLVSDEDDCSQAAAVFRGCEPPALLSVEAGVERIVGWRPSDSVMASAVVGVPDSACDIESGGRYADAVRSTDGVLVDLCTSDWAAPLEGIAAAAVGRRTVFELSVVPRPDTLRVRVDGWLQTLDRFTYDPDRNAVVFGEPPPQGARIEATYQR